MKLDRLNYKGPLLEQLISVGGAYISGGLFKSNSGDSTSEEIDAVLKFNDEILIVVECKSIAMSVGFDIGNEESIEFRKKKMMEALNQVERKGSWLSKHMFGHGYDLRKYKYILTVVVSPFVEFINTRSRKYWITENIPRVLTPGELYELTSGDVSSGDIHRENLVRVV